MKIAGITAEYNPVHLGHALHMEETRELTGCEGILCVMSGSFVQRGEPAAFSKFSRAKAAILAGADLVVENPLPWALSSAEGFARGAIGIMGAAGNVETVSFGSESGNVSALEVIANELLDPELDASIPLRMQSGISYPAAREELLRERLGDLASLIHNPNDLLGVEYIKAIRRQKLDLMPCAVLRNGSRHDASGNALPSSSEIRARLQDGKEYASLMPKECADIFAGEIHAGRGPVFTKDLEQAFLGRLRMMTAEEFAALPGASEGLDHKLMRSCRTLTSLSAVIAQTASRRYPLARVRRMVTCAALGISAEQSYDTPPYIRVLAMNETGKAMLHEMKQTARIPILVKGADVHSLGEECQMLFDLEARATDFWSLGCRQEEQRRCGLDYTTSPYVGN